MTPSRLRDLSVAGQDYLREVYRLEREQDERVTTSLLAAAMGVSAASATAMLKRLAAAGVVEHTPYRGVSLTPDGERAAIELIRHHRLLERYLAEGLGLPIDLVHAEADRLEHALSEELEARIDERLGFPTHDPHGHPIPDAALVVRDERQARRSLGQLESGEAGRVRSVPDVDAELLRYLLGLGLAPGELATVVSIAPFDGPVVVRTATGEHPISRELAGRIVVG